jgi:uncharacterized protein YndB with AHSA1/START domain
MSTPTPNVPLRLEFSIELEATPEPSWDAIATGNGITAWFMPTEVDEREGGTVLMHMGDDDSPATITGWDPPHRFAYFEPDWATLTGHDPASVTELATEFLVEAKSGGTCVLRVVTSAFGTGADWEQEFFDDMEKGWRPYFENLGLYLSNFPGQRVTSLTAHATIERPRDDVWAAMRRDLGAEAAGQSVAAHGIAGTVERIGTPPAMSELLIRLSEPVPGYLQFAVHGPDEGPAMTIVTGYLFSDDAPGYVERETPAWKAWLEGLAVPTS